MSETRKEPLTVDELGKALDEAWGDSGEHKSYNFITGVGRDPHYPLDMQHIVIGPGMKVYFGKWAGRKVKPSNYPFYDLVDEDNTK